MVLRLCCRRIVRPGRPGSKGRSTRGWRRCRAFRTARCFLRAEIARGPLCEWASSRRWAFLQGEPAGGHSAARRFFWSSRRPTTCRGERVRLAVTLSQLHPAACASQRERWSSAVVTGRALSDVAPRERVTDRGAVTPLAVATVPDRGRWRPVSVGQAPVSESCRRGRAAGTGMAGRARAPAGRCQLSGPSARRCPTCPTSRRATWHPAGRRTRLSCQECPRGRHPDHRPPPPDLLLTQRRFHQRRHLSRAFPHELMCAKESAFFPSPPISIARSWLISSNGKMSAHGWTTWPAAVFCR